MNVASLLRKPLRYLSTLSLAARLTLWSMTVFTLLFLFMGMLYYLHFRSHLMDDLDTRLQMRAQVVAQLLTTRHGTLILPGGTRKLTALFDPGPPTRSPRSLPELAKGATRLDPDLDLFIQIRDSQDHIRYSTPAFLLLPTPASSITAAHKGQVWMGTIMASNGEAIRLYSQPVTLSHSISGVILVGASIAPMEMTLQRVFLEFLALTPLVLLLGLLGSFWLAKRALQPVTRMTSVARTLQEGDWHARVPVPRSQDELHLLAVTFNELLDHLEHLVMRQRRFLSDASHELRTPVAALRSMIDVALDQPRSAANDLTLLRDLEAQTERLGHLITDLLTLARGDEGQIHFEQERVRLDQLVKDVAIALEPLAQEREILLEVQSQTPVFVLGDEARLMQVIMNVLDNALAYTGKGGQVTLQVETRGAEALIGIRDTGIGIPAEHLPHVFERFYRVETARSRKTGGSGLGLAICQWIVSLHGGSISVQSQEGQGSLFTISLPLAKGNLTTPLSPAERKRG
jgi:heavy metal sensor kinase